MLLSRTPQGVRGLKHRPEDGFFFIGFQSHSARSAWIETINAQSPERSMESRTPQGVRGLKRIVLFVPALSSESHSARSAWIETDSWFSDC